MIIMAVPYTFSTGTLAKSAEVNDNFTWTGMVPVGTILPWAKSITGVPTLDDRFVECNGQVLSDAESLLNGQTIPNLNGNANFLYGAATSGGTKTENFLPVHKHTLQVNSSDSAVNGYVDVSSQAASGTNNYVINNTSATGTAWLGYAVVYIIRVK